MIFLIGLNYECWKFATVIVDTVNDPEEGSLKRFGVLQPLQINPWQSSSRVVIVLISNNPKLFHYINSLVFLQAPLYMHAIPIFITLALHIDTYVQFFKSEMNGIHTKPYPTLIRLIFYMFFKATPIDRIVCYVCFKTKRTCSISYGHD